MTSQRRKPQTGKQLLLRFPEGSDLRKRLDQIAQANGRSTTAEVLFRLDASLQAEQRSSGLSFTKTVKAAAEATPVDSDLEARVAALEKAVKELKMTQSETIHKLEAFIA